MINNAKYTNNFFMLMEGKSSGLNDIFIERLFIVIEATIMRIREVTQIGSILSKNTSKDIEYVLYKYKFCGLPIGVSILPRFAAIVCKTIIGISRELSFVIDRISIVNGTNVISATSFVINILQKKQSSTRRSVSDFVVFIFDKVFIARKSNILSCFIPETTIIRQNKSERTLKSI